MIKTNPPLKIATLTFHNIDNYGAVLQAYALQHTLLQMGAETQIINYTRNSLSDVCKMFTTKFLSMLRGKPDKQLYSIKEFWEMISHGDGNTDDIHNAFMEFRKKYFICSKPVNKRTIKTLEKEFNYIIVGSDQVWNCGRVNLEPTYMLDFVHDDRKKISYAASFGISEIPDKYVEIYRNLLSKFSHISVREKQGVALVKTLTGKEASWVLDPTFLLEKEEWVKIADTKTKLDEKYILIYHLGKSDRMQEIAEKLSAHTGLPIRYVRKQKTARNSTVVKGASPSEWLSLFLGATYIITSSFHGVAFSINFNKEFYAVRAEDRIREAMQSRLEDILDRMELRDRYIKDFSEINLDNVIAYDCVNSTMKRLKEESMNYLKEVLKDNGNDL